MTELDARGLSCPQPVLETKKVLAGIQEGTITVIVDNPESKENVCRFAIYEGCNVEIDEKGSDFYVHITKRPGGEAKTGETKAPGRSVVSITTDRLGTGSEELGAILMRAFLNTLWDYEPSPEKVILINNGVLLATEGSAVLDALSLLEKKGVEILACGTCLAFYDLKDKLRVGMISNMHEIVAAMMTAGRVINIS